MPYFRTKFEPSVEIHLPAFFMHNILCTAGVSCMYNYNAFHVQAQGLFLTASICSRRPRISFVWLLMVVPPFHCIQYQSTSGLAEPGRGGLFLVPSDSGFVVNSKMVRSYERGKIEVHILFVEVVNTVWVTFIRTISTPKFNQFEPRFKCYDP